METGVLSLQEIAQCVTPLAKKYKIAEVYVFGSYARNEATSESDVDFLVELQKGASLFDLMDLQDEYEALLNCKVDVVSRRGLNPYLRDNVLREAVVL